MTNHKEIRLRQRDSEQGVAYLELWDHPHSQAPVGIQRSVDIHTLIDNYNGPRICLDLNGNGVPVGIEIVYSIEEDDEEARDHDSLAHPRAGGRRLRQHHCRVR